MKRLLLALLVLLMQTPAFGVLRIASVSGNWNNAAVWGGTVPAANDDIQINAGVTVTINVNPATIVNVTINGTLQWDATGTGRTWTVTGNFTVNSGGSFICAAPGTATTHTFNYNGNNLTNHGTFNLVNGSNKCNVTLGSTGQNNIGGSSPLTFNKLILNNTNGKFQIVYEDESFTTSELTPTKLNVSITTLDTMAIRQGLLIGCATNNATISHSFAHFKMGSGGSKITSSVSLSGSTTFTINTAMVLNDATNAHVTMTVTGTFTSPSMTQSNAATAYALLGPNCYGGSNNATTLNVNGEWNMTDIFVFVGNTKLYGGTEPNNPTVTCSGNVTWASTETHTIDLPFTSDDFYLKTCYFGLFDSQGAFPLIQLNGGSVSAPNHWNIAFDVFNAEIQDSSPLGNYTVVQISESMGNWVVNGHWRITAGNAIAVHSDNTLTINGSLRVVSNAEVAGSETETEDAGYVPTAGPKLLFGSSGVFYVENTAGLGNGTLAEASSNVAVKNRSADIDWDLNAISTAGTIAYEVNSQTVTARTYYHLTLNGGTKTLANAITVNGTLTVGSGTTLANGGYTVSAKGAVSHSGTHSGTGKIVLNGTTSQTLSGSGSEWGNVELNNSAGAVCSATLSTTGTFTFTNGVLTTSSSSLLSLGGSGTIAGGSSTSYVSGPMVKTTTSTSGFTFPVGKGGRYRAVTITPTSASSTTWMVEYFNNSYTNTSSVVAPITSVNMASYWTVDRTSGSANATVRLSWGSEEGLSDLNGLTVGRWNGSAWEDAGNTSVTGSPSSGTVTSATVSSFSPFTLAEANTISTGTVSGSPFCAEVTITVPFTSTGTFHAGNVYTVQISDKNGSFAAPTNLGTLASTANSGNINATFPPEFPKGKKYRIRVVSSNPAVIGTDNGSNLEMLDCAKPTGLTATGITQTSATISWNAMACAVEYRLQYRKQGTSGWTNKTTSTNSYTITGLTANTTYEYRARTHCTPTASTKSGNSAIQTFTTSPRLGHEPHAGPVLHPNPASDRVEVQVGDGTQQIRLSDITGRTISNLLVEDEVSKVVLDLSALPAGIYFVEVKTGSRSTTHKLIKE
ncbi:MAG: fibronectin type III domain-containing protein [Chitinophagales bacterium]|nr:fibronectin type III domain-containing protein [Chitinophagales bacterium]MDW8427439.1 T9SS type A sorting domain-containing protein [Chitinophagales bacterium]